MFHPAPKDVPLISSSSAPSIGDGTWLSNSYRPEKPAATAAASKKTPAPRPVRRFFATSLLSQASGSALAEMNSTKVVCAVHGPRAKRSGGGRAEFESEGTLEIRADFAPFARPDETVSASANLEARNREADSLSRLIERAVLSSVILEKFPKSVIEVHVAVLEDDGMALEAAVCAVSLALADAGVELYDLVAAASLTSSGEEEDWRLSVSSPKNPSEPRGPSVLIAGQVNRRRVTLMDQTLERGAGSLFRRNNVQSDVEKLEKRAWSELDVLAEEMRRALLLTAMNQE